MRIGLNGVVAAAADGVHGPVGTRNGVSAGRRRSSPAVPSKLWFWPTLSRRACRSPPTILLPLMPLELMSASVMVPSAMLAEVTAPGARWVDFTASGGDFVLSDGASGHRRWPAPLPPPSARSGRRE